MAVQLKKRRFKFKELSQIFSKLRNCDLRLRITDGEYSDTEEVAISKRNGTQQNGPDISGSDAVLSQFIQKNSDNQVGKHIISIGTYLKESDGDAWNNIQTGLTSGKFFSGISVNSYVGTGTTPKLVVPTFTGTLGTPVYEGGLTKLPSTGSPGWEADALVGMDITPTTSKPGNKYTIVGNSANTVWIEGDIVTAGDDQVVTGGESYKIEHPTVANKLVDTSKSWTEDEHAGKIVRITSGTGAGQMRRILGNTKTALSIGLPWEKDPDATSYYSIYSEEDQVLYLGNGVDSTLRYDINEASPTTVSSMPKGNMFIEYESRVIVAGDEDNPYSIYYSDIGDPEYFDPSFVIRPPGTDKVTGLATWNEKGIIFKERSIWIFTFEFNDAVSLWQVSLRKLPENVGCVSSRSIREVNNEVWFYTGKELRALGASETQIGVVRTRNLGFEIQSLLDGVDASEYDKVCSEVDETKYYISFPESGFQIVYSLPYDTWLVWDGLNIYSMINNENTIYAGTDRDGDKILEMNVKNRFRDGADSPIAVEMLTKGWSDNAEDENKKFFFSDFVFENIQGSAKITALVTTQRNLISVDSEFSIGHNSNSSGTIGEDSIGAGQIGGGTLTLNRFLVRKSIAKVGKVLQLKIENSTLDENVILIGLTNYFANRGVRNFDSAFNV